MFKSELILLGDFCSKINELQEGFLSDLSGISVTHISKGLKDFEKDNDIIVVRHWVERMNIQTDEHKEAYLNQPLFPEIIISAPFKKEELFGLIEIMKTFFENKPYYTSQKKQTTS